MLPPDRREVWLAVHRLLPLGGVSCGPTIRSRIDNEGRSDLQRLIPPRSLSGHSMLPLSGARIRPMALNNHRQAKGRDPADVFVADLALAISVSFFGAVWWYVLT
jgi:hypothetical protein